MYKFTVDTDDLLDLKTDPGTIAGPVTEEMFGAINANTLSYEDFEADYEAMGLTGLRFPGGSLAENDRAATGEWLYDPVAYETGFHPSHDMTGLATLDDMIAMALREGVTLSITVPVERFFGDPEAAAAWMSDFLEMLGAQDALPPIVLDIGNEAYSDPAAYGEVAAAMLGVVGEARGDGLDGVAVGVQVMKESNGSTANTQAMIDAIEAVDPALLAEIDAVRTHALDLPTRNSAQYEDVRHREIDLLMTAIEEEGGAPELHVSAWSVRGDDALPDDWDGSGSASLAASGALLSLFASMIELGATRADAWGVAVSDANRTALSYTGADGERVMAPHAVTLELMAESVVGLCLVDDGRLDVGTAGPIVQTYVGEGTVVLFLSAGDIDGPQDLSVAVEGFDATHAWADRVALIEGGAPAGAAHAVRDPVTLTDDGRILWTFEEDYETVRIVLSDYQGASGGIHVFGSGEGELLAGTAGDDLIEGMDGDDLIALGLGADLIDGGDGRDVLDASAYAGGARLTVDLHLGTATGAGLSHELASIETVIGSARGDELSAHKDGSALFGMGGADRLKGRGVGDDLQGGGGADTVKGGGGADVLHGNGGSDKVKGGEDDDTVIGGSGDDKLWGNAGDDILRGGTGDDLFVFERGHGDDVVRDFDLDGDRLHLKKLDLDGMGDLVILDAPDGARIDTGAGTITLDGVSAVDLSADDFIF